MLKKVVIGAALLAVVLVVVACAGPTSTPSSAAPAPKPSTTETPSSAQTPTPSQAPAAVPKPAGPIKAKWIEPQVDGDTVSIPQSEVENNWNVHFKVDIQGSTETFMAYVLDGKIYVRANVCPPCRSIGYSLDKDVLVCDRCATRFKAKSGDGIDGACVNYPKALVPYEIAGGSLAMKKDDLVVAYQNTLKPGLP
jgi:nitrite reductase/ring-hydroxylating ferredoxin subunit